MNYELRTVERTLELLDVLASGAPLRLNELTIRLDTNQSTVLRALRVLERRGLVRRTSAGSEYGLGVRLTELGLIAVSGIDVPHALRPLGVSLAREFGATVHVGMVRDSMITIIAKFDSEHSRVRYSWLGTRMPLHATAAGKAALAVMDAASVEELALAGPLQPYTPKSIGDLDGLRRQIQLAAHLGYSTELEEFQIGFSCVGSAFRLNGDVYTVSISGPSGKPEELSQRGELLRAVMQNFLDSYKGAARGMTSP